MSDREFRLFALAVAGNDASPTVKAISIAIAAHDRPVTLKSLVSLLPHLTARQALRGLSEATSRGIITKVPAVKCGRGHSSIYALA